MSFDLGARLAIASLTLQVPDTIEKIMKYASELHRLSGIYHNAQTISEKQQLRLNRYAMQYKCLGGIIRDLWNDLDEHLQRDFERGLPASQVVLESAQVLLNSFTENSGIASNANYAKDGKEGVDNLLQDLHNDLMSLNVSLQMIGLQRLSREAINIIDVKAKGDDVPKEIKAILQTIVAVKENRNAPAAGPLPKLDGVIEYVIGREKEGMSWIKTGSGICKIASKVHIVKSVTDNARKDSFAKMDEFKSTLSHIDLLAKLGIMRCEGYDSLEATGECRLLFTVPVGLSGFPTTLRELLIETKAKHPLSQRLTLAVRIASAISLVHSLKYVHKNVTPDNIVLLHAPTTSEEERKIEKERSVENAVLLGFQNLRLDEDASSKKGSYDEFSNLYRHPSRQGSQFKDDEDNEIIFERKYRMLDDIYSLGVVLLEIGRWRSLLKYQQVNTSTTTGTNVAKDAKSNTFAANTTKILEEVEYVKEGQRRKKWMLKHGVELQNTLIELADETSIFMGLKFANIVKRCLRCYEAEGGWATPELFQTGDLQAGLAFNRTVIGCLLEIKM